MLKSPEEFVDILRMLYSGTTAELLLSSTLTPRFDVTKGVRQGCRLSPILFVLTIDPMLRRFSKSSLVSGLPMPGTGCIKVSAYADDITLFLRDEGSLVKLFRIYNQYNQYASFSGGKIVIRKCEAFTLGCTAIKLPGSIKHTKHMQILCIKFSTSVSPRT